ncbi:MAG: biosynthetic peptidoglycan transglycosylase, partial [Candidatus Pelethousia sp.]|nr:biosynthetic peptidoglycan transglycosylase [Candidatus Pelethousia sp.]
MREIDKQGKAADTGRIDLPDPIDTDPIDADNYEDEAGRADFAAGVNLVFHRLRDWWAGLLHRHGGKRAGHDEEQELFVERRGNRPFLLAVLFATIKVMAVMVVLLGCAGMGLVMGVAKAYIDTTPELDTSQITKSDKTSYIYDKDGKLITTFAGMEYRDWADADEIPDMLKNALIAIEDVRFYKHDGVDYKRLFSAVVNTLRNADTHGGSTLTQQLIKNKVLSSEQSYKRKLKEAYLAVELENVFSKDQ